MFWLIGGAELVVSLGNTIHPPFGAFLNAQCRHSEWHGLTFYDILFPLFLAISGVTIPISISRQRLRGNNTRRMYLRIIKRVVLLFLLGFIANHSFNELLALEMQHVRFAGILQRIAVCYLVSAVLAMHCGYKGVAAVAALILAAYWALLALVPVPRVVGGVFSREGNLAFYLDRRFLPGFFSCGTWGDNEGLLSTVPAVASMLIGVLAGYLICSSMSEKEKLTYLAAAGMAGIGMGLLWSLYFPINKAIWSSSYVLTTGGVSVLLIGLFYWFIDVRGNRRWAFFFTVIGMNSLLIYVCKDYLNIERALGADIMPPLLALCMSAAGTALRWSILYGLYKSKIFITV